jgi:hypothetical protein
LGVSALESSDRPEHGRGRPAEPEHIRWHGRSGSAVSTRPPGFGDRTPPEPTRRA